MRVLHLATSFPSGPDSFAGAFVHQLVAAQVGFSLACTVVTPAGSFPTEWPPLYPVRRFRYAPWSLQRLAQQPGGMPAALQAQPLLFALLSVPFFAAMAVHLIREGKQHDLIHAHWSICGALAVLTRPLHGRPVVTTLRGSDVHFSRDGTAFRFLLNRAVRGSAAVVGVSKGMVNDLCSRFTEIQEKCGFVPNGVDERYFRIPLERAGENRPLRILFIGSLLSLKGIDVLIRALGRIREQPWTLTLVGNGPQWSELQELAGREQVAERVTFRGAVAPEKVAGIMADHHLLVLPSYREGLPNVVLEAMAAGLAVVASDIDGCRELIDDGKSGWLFPPGDVEELSALLRTIVAGSLDLHQAGKWARAELLRRGLTWRNTAERYISLYHNVLGRA
ncbi:MAG: glycosyltransferase [Thermodesulfobacteriota bacterium]